jgi:proteasome lid subunit RPN8/RPN11
VVIPAAMRDEIVAHARAGLPNEACGILAGIDGTAERFFPAEPDEPSPYYYRISSEDQIRIMNEIDDAGLDLIGIYHSHVSSPAYPSRTDAEQAFWPDAVYVIVSLANDEAEIKGYRIVDFAIDEEPLVYAEPA